MSAQPNSPRIVGCLARLRDPATVVPWQPLTKAAAQALPSRPPPPPRGWQMSPAVPTAPAATLESPAAPPAPVPATAAPLPSIWERLAQAQAQQVAPLLAHEHPQTIALILSQLEPLKAAGLLHHLPEQCQADVACRIATMEPLPPATFEALRAWLEDGLRAVLGGELAVGGPKVVADILNLSGANVEKRVLEQLDAQGPQVAEAVRNMMFVFDEIAKLSDREIQTLLREVDQKHLVVALKGASEELKQKILANMSEKVRTSIIEEMEFLGPMRLTAVEEVQLRIVQQVRQLEEKGKLTVVRGANPDVFV
jgi:flagellar motor switch protein FliG